MQLVVRQLNIIRVAGGAAAAATAIIAFNVSICIIHMERLTKCRYNDLMPLDVNVGIKLELNKNDSFGLYVYICRITATAMAMAIATAKCGCRRYHNASILNEF